MEHVAVQLGSFGGELFDSQADLKPYSSFIVPASVNSECREFSEGQGCMQVKSEDQCVDEVKNNFILAHTLHSMGA